MVFSRKLCVFARLVGIILKVRHFFLLNLNCRNIFLHLKERCPFKKCLVENKCIWMPVHKGLSFFFPELLHLDVSWLLD